MTAPRSSGSLESATGGTWQHRYPGPPPFEDTPEDRAVFFGRAVEIDATTQLVLASRVLTMFGKSGLGKTSLLNAGVFPRLRDEAFLPVRVRVKRGVAPVTLVTAALTQAASMFASDRMVPEVGTLWELFKLATFWRDETLLTPVLVFDQFEEAFTALDAGERAALAEELGALVSGNMPEQVRQRQRGLPLHERMSDTPPQVKLVVVLRDDYLAALQELTTSIPQLFQNRLRLMPMTDDQAAAAIRNPASLVDGGRFKTEPFEYDETAIDLTLGFLRGRSGHIEPWELQILCTHVERNVVPQARRAPPVYAGMLRVTAADLGGQQAMPHVLRSFYENELSKLPAGQRRRARELCDTGLVSGQGHRLSLERTQILHDWGVTAETLDQLIKARVLRRERRMESSFYEISHDTLAETIVTHRRLRLPRRLRTAAWVLGIALVAFMAVMVRKNQQLRAERQEAEDAQARADDLLSFVVGEDLLDRVRRSGQTTVLKDVRERVDAYLRTVPAERSTSGATRARALVSVIDGEMAMRAGDPEGAQAACTAAYASLRRLEQGASAEVTRALSQSMECLGDLAELRETLAAAVRIKTEALALREVLARTPATARERDLASRKFVADAIDLARVLRQQGHLSDARRRLGTVLPLVEAHGAADASLEWTYVTASAYMVLGELAEQQGDPGASRTAMQQAFAAAKRARRLAPYEWKAHYIYALAVHRLFSIGSDAIQSEDVFAVEDRPRQVAGIPGAQEPRVARAGTSTHDARATENKTSQPSDLAVYTQLHETVRLFAEWQSEDQQMLRELAASGLLLARAHLKAEHRDEAMATYARSFGILEQLHRTQPTNRRLLSDLSWAHQELAGAATDSNQAVAHLEKARALCDELARQDPSDRDAVYESVRIELQLARHLGGNKDSAQAAAAATRRGLQLLSQLPQVDPSDVAFTNLKIACQQQDASPEPRAALQSAMSAVAEARSALASNPGRHAHLVAHGSSLRHLGGVQASKKLVKEAGRSFDDAEAALKEALSIARRDDAHATEASDMNELAMVDLGRARLLARTAALRARDHYRLAAARLRDAMTLRPREQVILDNYVSVQKEVGDLLGEKVPPDFDGAAASYAAAEAALKLFLAQSESAWTWRQLFLLHADSIAPLQRRRRDTAKQLTALREAVEAAGRTVKLAPTDPGNTAGLARAHQLLGDALRDADTPDLKGAEHAYAQAERVLLRAIEMDGSAARWNLLFLLRYESMAPLKQRQKNAEGALETYRQAAAAAEKAVELDPASPVYASNLHSARRTLGLLLQADARQATVEHRRALDAITRAVGLSPNPERYLPDLVRAQLQMARMAHTGGNLKTDAAKAFEMATDTSLRLTRMKPRNPLGFNLLALCYFEWGALLAERGDLARSGQLHLRGVESARQAIRLDGKEPIYRENLYAALVTRAEQQARTDPAAARATYQEAQSTMGFLVRLSPVELRFRDAMQDVQRRLANLDAKPVAAPRPANEPRAGQH